MLDPQGIYWTSYLGADMVKQPTKVEIKPNPYIAKCSSLNIALLMAMNEEYSYGANVDILEYDGEFFVVHRT